MKIPYNRKSAGVSPLIATIILIAITIVGGVLVYTVLTGYISRYSGSDQVTVSSIQLTVAPPAGSDKGPGIVSISVKDTGNTQVTGMNLTFLNGSTTLYLSSVTAHDALQASSGSPLAPGLTTSGTYYVCANFEPVGATGPCPPGEQSVFILDGTYTYSLSCLFSDMSTVDTSGTVLASS